MAFRKFLLYGTAGVAGLYTSTWIYVRTTMGVCKSDKDLLGSTVIVTGANTGIGLETARNLAARNARVILACRNVSKGEEAKKDIVQSTGNDNVVVKQVDVSSFQSVREFAKDIMQNEKHLHVLVNNAGILTNPGNKKSPDGLEMVMATNHYGPFLLTNLLLPKLKESAPSRIVVVSSIMQEWAKKVDTEHTEDKKECKKMSSFSVYGKSKLANVLFTRELSDKLKGSGVTVNALHPGSVSTELQRDMKKWSGPMKCFRPFMKSPKEGAQTSIYVAVAEELEGVSGKYFSDCREKELKKHALDESAAKTLWEISEVTTGLKTA